MNEERWAPIPGLEDVYEVSDRGQVRSLDRVVPNGKGRTKRIKGRIRKQFPDRKGYMQTSLHHPMNPRTWAKVHQLVLEAFVGPCPPGLVCCHANDIPDDNRLENLRWDTPSSNQYDRVSHGKHHHANRIRCPHGHLLDAVKNHGDGEFWQRRCGTCTREANREREAAKWAKVDTCKKGHPLDGVSTWADGSERGRFCKTCRSENVSRQMTERHAKNRAEKTHCKYGHPMDGLRKRPGGLMVPYCKTCLRESSRRNHAKKAQR